MATQTPPAEVQSLRLSCDRCRSKKLGCTVSSQPTGSGAKQCVRCQNAKVCCVFGRRAPNTRRSSTAKPGTTAASVGERKTKPLAAKTMGVADKKSQRQKGTVTGGRLLSPPVALEDLLPADPSTDCASPLSSDPNTWYNGFTLSGGLGSTRGENGTAVDELQQGFFAETSLENEFLMDPCPLSEISGPAGLASLWTAAPDNGNWMSWESLSPADSTERQAASWSTGGSSGLLATDTLPDLSHLDSSFSATVATASSSSSSSSHAIKDLSDLVRDIHCTSNEMLAVAAESPRPHGPEDLQKYPVGQVLGLARRLYAGIHDFLSTHPGQTGQFNTKPVPSRNNSIHNANNNMIDPLSSMAWEASGEAFEGGSRNRSPSLVAQGDSHGSAASSSPRAVAAALPSSVAADLDTAAIPIMLLMVSCYVSLARLYQTAFAQMQDLVPRAPSKTVDGGDDAACSRLYVAVQMLLDEFQSVEDALAAYGGGGTAHDRRGGDAVEAECTTAWFATQLRTAQAMLEQEAAGRGNFGGVGGRMHAGMNLKAMLRERIFLCA